MSPSELAGLRICDLQDELPLPTPEAGPSRVRDVAPPPDLAAVTTKKRKGVLDGMIQAEITKRKRESLGMEGPGKTMGSSRKATPTHRRESPKTALLVDGSEAGPSKPKPSSESWFCGVCTL